jgi:hypothetical protein
MFKLPKPVSIISIIFILLFLYKTFYEVEINQSESNDLLLSKSDDDFSCKNHSEITEKFSFDFQEKPISISPNIQSTVSCSGNMNYEDGWRYRTCLFKNICYNKRNKKFLFYKFPNAQKIPVLFEPKYGHIYDFSFNNHGFVSLQANGLFEQSWAPIIINRRLPNQTQAVYLDEVHTLFMHQTIPYNSDRFIWEDVGTNFFSMKRLGVYNPNAVLIEYKNFPSNKSIFYQMYRFLVPAIASKVVDFSQYITEFSSNKICFRTLVTGGATPMFSSDTEAFHHGKEQLFYEYRNRILDYHGINLTDLPKQSRIILIKNSHQSIKNIIDIEYYIQTTYTNIQLDLIDLDQIPFDRQLHMLYKTTLLITPSVSISSGIAFLPNGASAIILSYPPSYSIDDVSLWNYFPHVRILYYHIHKTNDYIFDLLDSKNLSMIIEIDRLKELIDTVLDK